MADTNWAEDRAREIEGIFNCTSSREPLILAIAAELQRVADECIAIVEDEGDCTGGAGGLK